VTAPHFTKETRPYSYGGEHVNGHLVSYVDMLLEDLIHWIKEQKLDTKVVKALTKQQKLL